MSNIYNLLVAGFVIGFSIAAPIGPIGTLCIQRSLHNGFIVGLMCGLGAAVADALYASIAGFGLTMVKDFLLQQNMILGCIGGLFLCYLGIIIYRSRVVNIEQTQSKSNIWYAFFSTCLLTLMSPSTILPFAAVLTNFNSTITTQAESLSFVGGVFFGAALWFLLLSAAVSIFRTHITPALLSIVNKISGIAIILFGLYSIISALYPYLTALL